MSDFKAIEFLHEYPLSWKELDILNADRKSAFAIMCFAVSEVNALMKLYVFAERSLSGVAAIDYASLIQSHIVLRTWSAKLFEFTEFLKFSGPHNKTEDVALLSFTEHYLEEFKGLEQLKGYKAARVLRHETSNHYLIAPVKKNLEHVSQDANCTMYMHWQNGNSFYPIGEEVVFAGRLNREGAKGELSDAERTLVYRDWMSWNLEATQWLQAVHAGFFRSFIMNRFPHKYPKKRDYWIDPSFVGLPDEVKIPVFLRRTETNS